MSETTKKGKTYQDVKIEKLPNSEIEVSGEVPVEIVESHRSKTVKRLAKNIDLPGFRKGHVPEEMVVKHISEQDLLKEIAETALGKTYADIVLDNKLEVVGKPQVTITKLAPNNPIGFKIKSAVFPKIELPDYKKLAKAEFKKHDDPEKVTVSDEDMQAELEKIQKAMSQAKKDGEKDAPEVTKIDDEFAKSLGDFKDLADLKEKMSTQLLVDKKHKQNEKRRLALADVVIENSKLEVPEIFIEGEIDQMVASFNERVSRAGMELDDYLKQVNKKIEDLRKEWRTDAIKRSKLQLIFNEIANKENIIPDIKRLDREIEHVKEHYPEANEDSVRTYVTSQLINEKVFELLEGKEVTSLKEDVKNTENNEDSK